MNSYRESCHDKKNLEPKQFVNLNAKTQYTWNKINEININAKSKKEK
jgi:hypothetical protein